MKNNIKIQYRKSIRLTGYDYSQAGLYFITIATQGRKNLFGEIIDGKMILNYAGVMIDRLWCDIKNDFNNIKLHEYIIMPNHMHGIIQITDINTITVGADSISAQNDATTSTQNNTTTKRADMESAPTRDKIKTTIPNIIQSFKRHTTIQYIDGVKNKNWLPFEKRIWQRNYWEHIIRDEKSYIQIADYIKTNPIKWDIDKLNMDKNHA